jgi:thiamine-monophosphate kinase
MSQSEFDIIKKYFETPDLNQENEHIELGIGDDAALISVPGGQNLAISTDVLVEGVHFPENADAGLVAKKALAVNLSDLAAMAANPFCFTLGLILPDASEKWLSKFSLALGKMAKEYGIALVGGDVSQGPLTIAIQVHGTSRFGESLRRDKAKVGDIIYVTGTLGAAAAGLLCVGGPSHIGDSFKLIDDHPPRNCRDFLVKAYYEPKPRINFALRCKEYINSAIDISDGLQGDLSHILRASKVGARVEIGRIPVSKEASSCLTTENLYRAALYGGDDYELCVTVPPENCAKFEQEALRSGTRITRIGEIIKGSELQLVSVSETNFLVDHPYLHFNKNGFE